MLILVALLTFLTSIPGDDLLTESEADNWLSDAEKRSSSLAKLFKPSFEVGDQLIRNRVSGLQLKPEDHSRIVKLVRSQFELWDKQDGEISSCFIVNGGQPLPKPELKKMIDKFQRASDESSAALEKAIDEIISPEGEDVLLKYVMEVGSMEYLVSPIFNEILDLSTYQKTRIKKFVNDIENEGIILKKSTAAAKDKKSLVAAVSKMRSSGGAIVISILGTLSKAQLTRVLNSKPQPTTIEAELSKLPKELVDAFEDEQRLLNENTRKRTDKK